MNFPSDLKYTKSHEWIRKSDGSAVVGITDYAQHEISDVVYIELPKVGKKTEQTKTLAVVESVKSVSDVFAPVSGEVIEVNTILTKKPEIINEDAFGAGWIAKIKMVNSKELSKLMDADSYTKFCQKEKH